MNAYGFDGGAMHRAAPATRAPAAPSGPHGTGPAGEARASGTDELRAAKRRLYSTLIASAHLLDEPFIDRPELSPWALIKQRMKALDDAIDAAFAKEKP